MKTNILTTLLFAVAAGVCSGYAQTVAENASFLLPGRSTSDAPPYEFRTDKYDGGMSVSLTLNNVERVLVDSVTGKSRISVPGLSSTTFAGLPALPYKAFRIAPEGSGTPQIVVRDSTYIDCPVNLDHNPEIRYDSIGQPQFIEVARVDYSGFMPSDLARVTDTQIYRDRPIYTITIMPMKYDRATGMLRIFTSLDIDIEYTVQAQTYANAPTRSAAFNAYTKQSLALMGINSNPAISDPTIDPIITLDTLDITEDYLVLSCANYRQATDSLKEWKKNLGHRVHVVEDWQWTTAKVDSVIKSQYRKLHNLTNVLILGIQSSIPGISIKEYNPRLLSSERDAPTDYPYMLLDGTNSIPSVGYGRLCVVNAQQAMTAIQKIINYERNPSESPIPYQNAFVSGRCWYTNGVQDEDRFIPTLEDVRNILLAYNKNVSRIYNTEENENPTIWHPDYFNFWGQSGDTIPDYLRKPQFAWNGTRQDIINAFNNGVNVGIYNGHGSTDGWPAFNFDYYACQELVNNHNPLIFSIGCNIGEHTYVNILPAELSRRESGAIAVFASTCVTRLGLSDALLIGFIDAIWPNAYSYSNWDGTQHNDRSYTQLKDILSRGFYRLECVQGGGYWDNVFMFEDDCKQVSRVGFHIFGDPSLYFNAQMPTHFSSVDLSYINKKLYISLAEEELPARIVFKNPTTGNIKTYQVTSSGVDYPLQENDSVIISISGPGKIPYMQTVSASDFILAKPDAYITNVTYNTGDQTAVVTYYKKEIQKAVSVGIRDLNNNIYVVPTSFGPQDNQQTLNLSELANGIYVITLMIDNEIKDTYKLIKR